MDMYSVKNFLPLIVIFSIIIIATIIKQSFATTVDAHSVMSDFMGIFFLVFGSFKIFNLSAFASAYAQYDLIAQRSSLYAHLYPFIECGLGVMYLMRWFPVATNVFTLIIMLISAAGVAQALYQGQHLVCACLGALFKIPMTYVTLLEDLLMALMAAVMLYFA